MKQDTIKIIGQPKFNLEEFLSYYVFKDINIDKINLFKQKSQIVRIYYDFADADHWFEFGISDYSASPDPLSKILTRDILDMAVVGFYIDDAKLCISVAPLKTSLESSDYTFTNSGNKHNPEA